MRGLYPFKVFGVCAAMDTILARRYLPVHAPPFGAASTLGSAHVSFNTKGNSFTVMEPIMKALPNARHLLMYRDVRKVASALSHMIFFCFFFVLSWTCIRWFSGARAVAVYGGSTVVVRLLFCSMYVPLHRARFVPCVACPPCVFVFPCCCSSRRGTISLTQSSSAYTLSLIHI